MRLEDKDFRIEQLETENAQLRGRVEQLEHPQTKVQPSRRQRTPDQPPSWFYGLFWSIVVLLFGAAGWLAFDVIATIIEVIRKKT
jgi:hypothetical protein